MAPICKTILNKLVSKKSLQRKICEIEDWCSQSDYQSRAAQEQGLVSVEGLEALQVIN